MAKDQAPPPSRQEVRDMVEAVPLLAAFFQRARTEMPDELREAFQQHQLTARHGAVLVQLLAQQEIGVTALARRMGVSVATASELVADLGRTGWVDSRQDPSNRRRSLVSLDDDHRAAVESFVALRSEPLIRALESLSPLDRKGFVKGLAAWTREVSTYW